MKLVVSSRESGQKLLKYLMRKTDGTKIFLFKCFRKKKVKVNGKAEDAAYLVKEGDQIDCHSLQEHSDIPAFHNVNPDISLLKITSGLAAVDKPAGVLVHAAGGKDYSDTLVEKTKAYLAQHGEAWDFLVPVHRLDQNTSGVVIFARNFETAKAVNELIKTGQVKKTYLALLEGRVDGTLFVTADIQKDREHNACVALNLNTSEKVPDKKTWMERHYDDSASISATVIKTVKSDGKSTLCKIELWTGRHHQIRAVCKALGHPVCGDRKYGAKSRTAQGQELVCWKMEIPALDFAVQSRFSLEI